MSRGSSLISSFSFSSLPARRSSATQVYGMEFGGLEVHFKVDGEVLTVTGIDRR